MSDTVKLWLGNDRREVTARDGETVTVPRDEDGSWTVEWDAGPSGGGSAGGMP
jgi:hypothetical protein